MTAIVRNLKPAPLRESSMHAQQRPFTPDQDEAVRILANALHRLNHAVERAVDSGVTVELIRACRHHDARGHWGDQLVPVISRQG